MRAVTLPDGRRLEALLRGASSGPVVVVHHGSPGSALEIPALEAAAAARGLRLVLSSRAGYAGSSRDAGRDVAAAARDTAWLLDALGVGRFATMGWSGGGPHAIACAALLEGRCAAAISAAGPAPYLPGELEFTDGMDEENVKEFEAAIEGGAAYESMLAEHRDSILAFVPTASTTARDLFGGLASDRDNDGTTPEEVAGVHRSMAVGLASSIDGWLDDDQAFIHAWGFDVGAVGAPVSVWYGDHDRMVPARHGEWLAAHVRGAVERRFPDEGHLTLVLAHPGEILDALVELAEGAW